MSDTQKSFDELLAEYNQKLMESIINSVNSYTNDPNNAGANSATAARNAVTSPPMFVPPPDWAAYVPNSHWESPDELKKRVHGVFHDSTPPAKLKAKCWICQKEISPFQHWDFMKNKNIIELRCCKREQKIELLDSEIEKSNAQGVFWAFMT